MAAILYRNVRSAAHWMLWIDSSMLVVTRARSGRLMKSSLDSSDAVFGILRICRTGDSEWHAEGARQPKIAHNTLTSINGVICVRLAATKLFSVPRLLLQMCITHSGRPIGLVTCQSSAETSQCNIRAYCTFIDLCCRRLDLLKSTCHLLFKIS